MILAKWALALAALVFSAGLIREYIFYPIVWPVISKQIGPTDAEIRRVVEAYVVNRQVKEASAGTITYEPERTLLTRFVKIQKVIPECANNELTKFLVQSKVLSVTSDCRVERIQDGHWLYTDQGAYYEVRPMSASFEELEVNVTPVGADYALKFKLPVKNSPFSAALGKGFDSIRGYRGEMTLRYTKDLLSNWLPVQNTIVVTEFR